MYVLLYEYSIITSGVYVGVFFLLSIFKKIDLNSLQYESSMTLNLKCLSITLYMIGKQVYYRMTIIICSSKR